MRELDPAFARFVDQQTRFHRTAAATLAFGILAMLGMVALAVLKRMAQQ